MQIKKNAVGKYEAIEAELSSREGTDDLPYFDLTDAESVTFVVRGSDAGFTEKRFECEILSTASVPGGSKLRLRYEPEAGDFPASVSMRGYFLVVVSDGERQSKAFAVNVVPRF